MLTSRTKSPFAASCSRALTHICRRLPRHSLNDTRCRWRLCKCDLSLLLISRMLNEFSGHMQDGLYYIARAAEMDGRGVVRDTEVLESSMEGMGTKDERL